MDEYISKDDAVDAGYLSDWYISSVGDESPVWTDEHIDELLNDFLVIPKDTPSADVQPVKHGQFEEYSEKEKYEVYKKYHIDFDGVCSECGSQMFRSDTFCAGCGARMGGDSE